MHRLSLRASVPLLTALILCVCGLNCGLPKFFSSSCLVVPLLPLLIIEVGVTLAAALLIYDEATPVHSIKVSLVILAITAAFAGLAHLANAAVFSDIRLRPGSQAPVLTINWVFVLTVNVSAIAMAKALIVLSSAAQTGRKRPERPQSDR